MHNEMNNYLLFISFFGSSDATVAGGWKLQWVAMISWIYRSHVELKLTFNKDLFCCLPDVGLDTTESSTYQITTTMRFLSKD